MHKGSIARLADVRNKGGDHLAEETRNYSRFMEAMAAASYASSGVSLYITLAGQLRESGRSVEAAELLRDLLDGPHGRGTDKAAIILGSLGSLLNEMGRLPEAEALLREGLVLMRRSAAADDSRGPSSSPSLSSSGRASEDLIRCAYNLATAMRAQGKYTGGAGGVDGPVSLYTEALAGYRRIRGTHHRETNDCCNALARLLALDLGRYAEAEPYCREAIEGRLRLYGETHEFTWSTRIVLVVCLAGKEDRLPRTTPVYEVPAIEGARKTKGAWEETARLLDAAKGSRSHSTQSETALREAIKELRLFQSQPANPPATDESRAGLLSTACTTRGMLADLLASVGRHCESCLVRWADLEARRVAPVGEGGGGGVVGSTGATRTALEALLRAFDRIGLLKEVRVVEALYRRG
jgi:tetratricopeptide (TPR) repeat protein